MAAVGFVSLYGIKMIRQASLILLLITLSLKSSAQTAFDSTKVDSGIMELCQQIALDSMIQSKYVDYEGRTPQQWHRYEQMQQKAADSVLYELTNHQSPVVRGYAFLGLLNRNKDLLISAIKKNEADTAVVVHQQGCIISFQPLIDYVITYTYFSCRHNRSLLTKSQYRYIKERKAEVDERTVNKKKG
jgi:hypothetical protein